MRLGHIAGLFDLQARSRRNALEASRLMQARRAEQFEADRALRDGGPPWPGAQRRGAVAAHIPAQSRTEDAPRVRDDR
jgi:hypothetical protein